MTREEAVSKAINIVRYFEAHFAKSKEAREDATNIIEALEQEPCDDTGEISDGYHTFNQLYHQRAILFATIVNQNAEIAWKSYKHSDGKYCFDSNGEWFIVGVDTPEGSYTYHYSKEYWDYFKCKELDCGKEWDGHTEEDVTRLLSLKEYCDDAISRKAVLELVSDYDLSMGQVVKGIHALPSVSPQQKMGQWIYDYTTADEHRTYHCSVCGCFLKPKHSEPLNSFKWCSLCGAKMQEIQTGAESEEV